MFIYSRTATIEDFDRLQVTQNIMRYAETKKNFTLQSQPRYKFWDYSLVIELARQENIKTIMDIGNGNDITYEILCNWHQLTLKQLSLKEFQNLRIRQQQYPLVTILAQLEHIPNTSTFLTKVLKHVSYDGYLVITTDEETSNKYKKIL